MIPTSQGSGDPHRSPRPAGSRSHTWIQIPLTDGPPDPFPYCPGSLLPRIPTAPDPYCPGSLLPRIPTARVLAAPDPRSRPRWLMGPDRAIPLPPGCRSPRSRLAPRIPQHRQPPPSRLRERVSYSSTTLPPLCQSAAGRDVVASKWDPIRPDPIRSTLIRSDPIRSDPL